MRDRVLVRFYENVLWWQLTELTKVCNVSKGWGSWWKKTGQGWNGDHVHFIFLLKSTHLTSITMLNRWIARTLIEHSYNLFLFLNDSKSCRDLYTLCYRRDLYTLCYLIPSISLFGFVLFSWSHQITTLFSNRLSFFFCFESPFLYKDFGTLTSMRVHQSF